MIDNFTDGLARLNVDEIIKSFSPLFVSIDVLGAIPIILQIRGRGQDYSPSRVAIYSGLVLILFLFAGEIVLDKLGVDVASFGAAGGVILMAMACEMTFGSEIFKDEGASSNATVIPLVFPLFAGAAAFTTLLNLQSQGMANINLLISVVLNMVLVYIGTRYVDLIEQKIGKQGSYILRKVFGVILIAIAIKYMVSGVMGIIASYKAAQEKSTAPVGAMHQPSVSPLGLRA